MKERILFALMMGIITTGVVSFVLVLVNRGWAPGFIFAWVKSWIISYIVALPLIILVSPKIQILVSRLCSSNAADHQT